MMNSSNVSSNQTDTTPPPPELWLRVVYIVYLIVIHVVGVPSNIVAAIIYGRTSPKTACDWMILTMSITDAFVCFFSPILYLRTEFGISAPWHTKIFCILEYWFNLTVMIASCILLVAIAVDRYIKICRPKLKSLTPLMARNVSLLCVVFAALTCVFPFTREIDETLCYVDDFDFLEETKIFFTAMFGCFVVSFAIVAFAYASICKRICEKVMLKTRLGENNGLALSSRNRETTHNVAPSSNLQQLTRTLLKWRHKSRWMGHNSENKVDNCGISCPGSRHEADLTEKKAEDKVCYPDNQADINGLLNIQSNYSRIENVDADHNTKPNVKDNHFLGVGYMPQLDADTTTSKMLICNKLHSSDTGSLDKLVHECSVNCDPSFSRWDDSDIVEAAAFMKRSVSWPCLSQSINSCQGTLRGIVMRIRTCDQLHPAAIFQQHYTSEPWLAGSELMNFSCSPAPKEAFDLITLKCFWRQRFAGTTSNNRHGDNVASIFENRSVQDKVTILDEYNFHQNKVTNLGGGGHGFRYTESISDDLQAQQEVSETVPKIVNTSDIHMNLADFNEKAKLLANITPIVLVEKLNSKQMDVKETDTLDLPSPFPRSGLRPTGSIASRTSSKSLSFAEPRRTSRVDVDNSWADNESEVSTALFMSRWKRRREKNACCSRESVKSTSIRRRFARERQMTLMLVSVTAAFLLSWIPPWIIYMLSFYSPSDYIKTGVYSHITTIHLFHYVASPIIYFLFNPTYRSKVKKLSESVLAYVRCGNS